MQKVLTAGLLAIALIAASQQQASAWTNSKFGIGLNWERQSGGNNFFWGAWKNGQVPGPEAYQNGGPFAAQGAAPYAAPYYTPYAAMPTPQEAYAMPTAQPAYAPAGANYGSPYQLANYPQPTYYYYPTPSYYYGR